MIHHVSYHRGSITVAEPSEIAIDTHGHDPQWLWLHVRDHHHHHCGGKEAAATADWYIADDGKGDRQAVVTIVTTRPVKVDWLIMIRLRAGVPVYLPGD